MRTFATIVGAWFVLAILSSLGEGIFYDTLPVAWTGLGLPVSAVVWGLWTRMLRREKEAREGSA